MGIVSKKRITDALVLDPRLVYYIHGGTSIPYILELQELGSFKVNRTWVYSFHRGAWND